MARGFPMRRFSAVILGFGLIAGGAHADITAEDVWRDWQAYLAGFGYEVTGTPERGAAGMVIADLGLVQELPEEGGRIAVRMGRIELAERGDGTVAVIYPESLPMAIAVTPSESEAVTGVLTLTHTALEIIVSGTPDAMRYDYTADALGMVLGEVVVDGTPLGSLEARADLADIAGTSVMQPGNGARQMEQTLASGPVSYALRFEVPEEAIGLDYFGTTASMTLESRMTIPDGTDMAQMGAALAAGLDMEVALGFGAGEGRHTVTEAGETTRVTSRNARGRFDFALSDEGVRYGGAVEEVRAEVELPALPMPLAYEAARMGGRLAMPLTPGAEPRDFALVLELDALRLSESTWSLFDPGALLPRDPIDLGLDLSGKGRLTVDLFDPAQLAGVEASGAAPVEIERLDLNRLLISLAAARLTGAGGVDVTPGGGSGIPPAEGAFDLRLEGGTAFLERLVALGVVSEDQALMVGMMAGMFAQPVEGEDTLTSRIELTGDGTITVNGQKLR